MVEGRATGGLVQALASIRCKKMICVEKRRRNGGGRESS
jgi:hypothetical protein